MRIEHNEKGEQMAESDEQKSRRHAPRALRSASRDLRSSILYPRFSFIPTQYSALVTHCSLPCRPLHRPYSRQRPEERGWEIGGTVSWDITQDV